MESENVVVVHRVPWNKGKLTGQKPPLKLREIWAIRTRLQMASNVRELAMFNLAIDSKLRACDLTRLQVQDVRHGSHVASRATVMQQKTQRPVQVEITEQTRESLEVDRSARIEGGGFSVPEPEAYVIASVDAAICPAGSPLARIDWPRRYCVRHPYDAPHKGFADLPADEKPSGGTVAARTYEAGKHGSLSRD